MRSTFAEEKWKRVLIFYFFISKKLSVGFVVRSFEPNNDRDAFIYPQMRK